MLPFPSPVSVSSARRPVLCDDNVVADAEWATADIGTVPDMVDGGGTFAYPASSLPFLSGFFFLSDFFCVLLRKTYKCSSFWRRSTSLFFCIRFLLTICSRSLNQRIPRDTYKNSEIPFFFAFFCILLRCISKGGQRSFIPLSAGGGGNWCPVSR